MDIKQTWLSETTKDLVVEWKSAKRENLNTNSVHSKGCKNDDETWCEYKSRYVEDASMAGNQRRRIQESKLIGCNQTSQRYELHHHGDEEG